MVDLYGWKGYVKLASDAMRYLRFLRENIVELNGHEMVEGTTRPWCPSHLAMKR